MRKKGCGIGQLIVVVLALAALSLLVIGCGTTTTSTVSSGTGATVATESTTTGSGSGASGGEIKIGVTLPLSGFAANYGREAQMGLELAVEQVNEAGGINGKTVVALVEDSAGDAKSAASAAQKLINVDKVVALVGTMFSAEAQAQAPIGEAAKIPMILGMANAPGLNELNEYVFVQFVSAKSDAAALAGYTVEKLGKKKVGVLASEGAYGIALLDLLKADFAALGGEVVVGEIMPSSTTDFKTVLGKIKDSGAEAVALIDLAQTAVVIRQMSELGMDVPLMGSSMLRDSSVLDAVGDLLEGAYYPMPGPIGDEALAANKKFVDAYVARYKEEITTVTPFLAYDAAMLAMTAIKEAGESGDAMVEWLSTVKDFPGTLGELTFKDNLAVRPDFIEKVENGEYVRTDYYVEGQ